MKSDKSKALPLWVGPVLIALTAAVVLLLGLLGMSIVERRWEAQRPVLVAQPVGEWESDPAAWGVNYPRQYERYMNTAIDTTRTLYGGGYPRDYLEINPRLVILYAGSAFSEEYLQARGHYYAHEDVSTTKRLSASSPATCWTCKSSDVPRLINEIGAEAFYAQTFDELRDVMQHSLSCLDCHDPVTMNLRITRPALREAYVSMGRDIDKATHQEMRSLVCAQCHVEYYFGKDNKLIFPWAKGKGADGMLEYFENIDFSDHIHAISGTPIIKVQHPDYEVYTFGIHAYRGVSCADCHMPYRTEGGMKFSDHHIQSPLLNVANSCGVCHRWSEDEIITRVKTIQQSVHQAKQGAEEALVKAHFDIAAAVEAEITADRLTDIRRLVRAAQFRWDYVSSNNGMGFHAPQECLRILNQAVADAQEARVQVARLLAAEGISKTPEYPDVSTREKAVAVVRSFQAGNPEPLLFAD